MFDQITSDMALLNYNYMHCLQPPFRSRIIKCMVFKMFLDTDIISLIINGNNKLSISLVSVGLISTNFSMRSLQDSLHFWILSRSLINYTEPGKLGKVDNE